MSETLNSQFHVEEMLLRLDKLKTIFLPRCDQGKISFKTFWHNHSNNQ